MTSIVEQTQQQQPRQPPRLQCATPIGSQTIYAEKGKDTAVVQWTEATATDMYGNSVKLVNMHLFSVQCASTFQDSKQLCPN